MTDKQLKELEAKEIEAELERQRFQYTEWIGTIEKGKLKVGKDTIELIGEIDAKEGDRVFIGGTGEYASHKDGDNGKKTPKAIEVKVCYVR